MFHRPPYYDVDAPLQKCVELWDGTLKSSIEERVDSQSFLIRAMLMLCDLQSYQYVLRTSGSSLFASGDHETFLALEKLITELHGSQNAWFSFKAIAGYQKKASQYLTELSNIRPPLKIWDALIHQRVLKEFLQTVSKLHEADIRSTMSDLKEILVNIKFGWEFGSTSRISVFLARALEYGNGAGVHGLLQYGWSLRLPQPQDLTAGGLTTIENQLDFVQSKFANHYLSNCSIGRCLVTMYFCPNLTVEDGKLMQRDMGIISRIQHPNLSTLQGFLYLQSYMCFAQPPCSATLNTLISQVTAYENRYRIAIQIAQALFYLHSQTPEVIHGFLGVNDIVFDSERKLIVCGYGNKFLKSLLVQSARESNDYVPEKYWADWMSPELITKFELSTKSDVYSLGVILCALECGQSRIFSNEDIYRNVVDKKVTIPAQVPLASLNLIERCLTYDPEGRPDMKEVVDELILLSQPRKPSTSEPQIDVITPKEKPPGKTESGEQMGSLADVRLLDWEKLRLKLQTERNGTNNEIMTQWADFVKKNLKTSREVDVISLFNANTLEQTQNKIFVQLREIISSKKTEALLDKSDFSCSWESNFKKGLQLAPKQPVKATYQFVLVCWKEKNCAPAYLALSELWLANPYIFQGISGITLCDKFKAAIMSINPSKSLQFWSYLSTQKDAYPMAKYLLYLAGTWGWIERSDTIDSLTNFTELKKDVGMYRDYSLGCLFAATQGPENAKKTLEFFEAAAKKGHATAALNVFLIKSGVGSGHTGSDAFAAWLDIAQRLNHPIALFKKLVLNQAQNPTFAEDNILGLVSSARQGFSDAQFQLGNYEYNRGASLEEKKIGLHWIEKAKNQGHEVATVHLYVLKFRQEFEKFSNARNSGSQNERSLLDQYKLEMDKAQGLELYAECIQLNSKFPSAELDYCIGLCHFHAIGMEQNPEKALESFKKASSKGHMAAALYCAGILDEGLGVEQNLEEAIVYYRKALPLDEATIRPIIDDIQQIISNSGA
eukprot:TRINITY_DN5040_c0_g1_i1.p1 TRINITY_DN5040_c0_g1~~TRINITY_DN5040_c0_g1_i1.p1  ORF type:complete len:1006 (+),score=148.69 TRINITY_DN5040_c0_g1_i1:82-3099(+)